MKTDYDVIKKLFNIEKLKIADALFFKSIGIDVICGDGKVESVEVNE